MINVLSQTVHIAAKEFRTRLFAPATFLILAVFLAGTLFILFRVEAFFDRGIANLDPLFQWQPILLIFLAAALTMRAWPQENPAGTPEGALTAATPLALVLGRLFATLALVAITLALTATLPLTVATHGKVDWVPVVGSYIGTLFLAAAYISIGLAVSMRATAPMAAPIITVAVCGALYLIGTPMVTGRFSYEVSSVLTLLGSGARLESIRHGLLDPRDFYYYLSIAGVCLTSNVFALKRSQYVTRPRLWATVYALMALNFAAANLWLAQINCGCFDIASAGASLSPIMLASSASAEM